MKNQIRLFLSLITIIAFTFTSCNSDNVIEEEETIVNSKQIEDNKRAKGSNPTCTLIGPDCGYPGYSVTFEFYPTNPNHNVQWSYSGSGISGIMGNGNSQVFNLASNFNGGTIDVTSLGELGCKDTFYLPACDTSPTCSISGPNCGVIGDQLTYTFTGASPVSWSSLSSGITLTSSFGNSATFTLNSNFTSAGGTIRGSVAGSCVVDFDIDDCCAQRIVTTDSKKRRFNN
jgi:hypothetical protein